MATPLSNAPDPAKEPRADEADAPAAGGAAATPAADAPGADAVPDAGAAPAAAPDEAGRLASLRARLDAVDTGIHRLLRERFEIVEEIGAAKGPQESVIRPAREAAVIENRLALHKGSLPPEMLAHIWRTLMAAACAVQRPFAVHTADALDAALYLYGPVSVTVHERAAAAVEALGEGDVAVVREDSDWWQARGEVPLGPGGNTVIARAALEGGGAVLVLGGPRVAPGAGPDAAVMRDGRPMLLAAATIGPDDRLLGRYHSFPLTIPAARTAKR